jgi:putative flippase GtrA
MRQVGMFLLAGGIAAAVNVLTRIGFSTFLPLAVAVVLAYLCGMVVAFGLNRQFVFKHATDDIGRRAGRFVVVNVLAVLQTLLVTLAGAWLLRDTMAADIAEAAAHVVGVLVPVFSSYVMHKRWTFSRHSKA